MSIDAEMSKSAFSHDPNLFLDAAVIVAGFEAEIDMRRSTLSEPDFALWQRWHKSPSLRHHLLPTFDRVLAYEADLEAMRSDAPEEAYYIDIAHGLYGHLRTHASLGLDVLHAATDIRSRPPEVADDETVQNDARLAVPVIQAGLKRLTDQGYLPVTNVKFTGHRRHEPYYWAIVNQRT